MKRGRYGKSIKMKYFFIAFLLYKNLHSSHANLKNSARRLFWNLCFKRSEKVGQLLTRLTWKLFCLPCRHFHNLSASLIFRSLFDLEGPLSFLRTTNNKIHFIGLDFHFYSCDFVIVFCKAWTSLRDRRLA